DGVPAFIVGSRRELRDVVDRRIGLDAAELAEVVDGMTAIPGAAADAQQEQASGPLAERRQLGCHALDRGRVDLGRDAPDFSEEFDYVLRHSRGPVAAVKFAPGIK